MGSSFDLEGLDRPCGRHAPKRRASAVSVLLGFLAAIVAIALASCASTEKGDGGESHFVHCTADVDCARAGLGRCVAGTCGPKTGAPDGGFESCASSPTFLCVPACGMDGQYQPVCVDAGWSCPANAPVRTDRCPEQPCSGPLPLLPPCCAADGVVGRLCDDAGNATCPAGSYEVKGNCPTDCSVPSSNAPLPYAMTFRFTNATGKDVSVWHGCTYEHTLAACASGYSAPAPDSVFCSAICPSTDLPQCGACYDEPAPVSAATPLEVPWDGYLYEDGSFAGRPCAARVALPETRYRLTVPVYPGSPPRLPSGGFEKKALYSVSVDFVTSPGGVVDVPIDQPPAP